MMRILYKFLSKFSSRIIEEILIEILLLKGIISYMADFFTSYPIFSAIVFVISYRVFVYLLDKTGINTTIYNWVETKYIRTDLVTQIFEANPELTVKQFVRNFYLCTKKELGFTEDELKEKLYRTCNYLLIDSEENSNKKLLDTRERFKFIFSGENEDENLYITPDGFEKWVKEAKIRLP
jgi:hypothetical protein